MNKGLVTNVLAVLLCVVGFVLEQNTIKTIGLFALSGAITNWLAVHMLFEKIPGLYGSGVIPERFDDFKEGIRNLIMTQFFTHENIQKVLSDSAESTNIDISPVIEKADLSPSFDALIEVIQASSFGQMLGMFGGVEALEPMRKPFIEKMKTSISSISQEPSFTALVQAQLGQPDISGNLHGKVEQIVNKRLDELSPNAVKEIIQLMIKTHLGWLVVWGGVFGGVIGFVAAVLV